CHALGVIRYETLEPRRPSCGLEPMALLERIVNEAPAPLSRADVPHGLAELITHKLLAKSPDDRLGSMVEVSIALDAFTTQVAPRADQSDLIPRPVAVRESTVELVVPRTQPWLA